MQDATLRKSGDYRANILIRHDANLRDLAEILSSWAYEDPARELKSIAAAEEAIRAVLARRGDDWIWWIGEDADDDAVRLARKDGWSWATRFLSGHFPQDSVVKFENEAREMGLDLGL